MVSGASRRYRPAAATTRGRSRRASAPESSCAAAGAAARIEYRTALNTRMSGEARDEPARGAAANEAGSLQLDYDDGPGWQGDGDLVARDARARERRRLDGRGLIERVVRVHRGRCQHAPGRA